MSNSIVFCIVRTDSARGTGYGTVLSHHTNVSDALDSLGFTNEPNYVVIQIDTDEEFVPAIDSRFWVDPSYVYGWVDSGE